MARLLRHWYAAPTSVLGASLLIAGAIVWAAETSATATQCAGFLTATTMHPSLIYAALGEPSSEYTAKQALAELAAIGCKLNLGGN